MKIGLVHLDDSAYFNLKMRFIILKYNVLQTRIAKLGHFLLAFVLGRRIESGSEGKFCMDENAGQIHFFLHR